MTPFLQLRGVTRSFEPTATLAEHLARLTGLGGTPPVVRAVDEVSLEIREGEVLGLVGESGCGKSTLARVAAGLLAPTAGQVLLEGRDRFALEGAERKAAQLSAQMIFQDPMASLNPRMRVAQLVGEAPARHGLVAAGDLPSEVARLLGLVGLDPSLADRFPHQLSGGQRARVGIARALGVRPRMLICDEALAALDVSVQAQVLNLFMKLRSELRLTYLFVSHDLSVVRHIADRVAVMYLGRIVEQGTRQQIFAAPRHPYTQALLAEAPSLDQRRRSFGAIRGEIPSPLDPPPGCHFHTRCPRAESRCRASSPQLRDLGSGHQASCHLLE